MINFVVAAPSTMGQFIDRDGNVYSVSAAGTITVPAAYLVDALRAGCTLTDSELAGTAAIALSKIAHLLSDRVLTKPALAIGSTDTQVANGAFDYQIGAAAAVVNTLKKAAAVAAGTALAAGTIPADTWGIYLYAVDAADAKSCVAGAANFTTGYASEAAAIAALPATPGSKAALGYVTVKTKAGQPFVGRTDSLKGGATGNVASETNYYDAGLGY